MTITARTMTPMMIHICNVKRINLLRLGLHSPLLSCCAARGSSVGSPCFSPTKDEAQVLSIHWKFPFIITATSCKYNTDKWIQMCIPLIKWPFGWQTIRQSDTFGPFKYRTSPLFGSPLYESKRGILKGFSEIWKIWDSVYRSGIIEANKTCFSKQVCPMAGIFRGSLISLEY